MGTGGVGSSVKRYSLIASTLPNGCRASIDCRAPSESFIDAYRKYSHTAIPEAVGSRSQSGGVSQMNARMTITQRS